LHTIQEFICCKVWTAEDKRSNGFFPLNLREWTFTLRFYHTLANLARHGVIVLDDAIIQFQGNILLDTTPYCWLRLGISFVVYENTHKQLLVYALIESLEFLESRCLHGTLKTLSCGGAIGLYLPFKNVAAVS